MGARISNCLNSSLRTANFIRKKFSWKFFYAFFLLHLFIKFSIKQCITLIVYKNFLLFTLMKETQLLIKRRLEIWSLRSIFFFLLDFFSFLFKREPIFFSTTSNLILSWYCVNILDDEEQLNKFFRVNCFFHLNSLS